MWERVLWAGVLQVIGWFWNGYLFPLGGVFGDCLTVGRWVFCVGDIAYLVSFACLLSIPMRRREGVRRW